MSRLNEPDKQLEPIMNEINVSTTFFKKIYKLTEIYYGNSYKPFTYITIEVEFYENEDENVNVNVNDDNSDNNSIYTNINIDTDARSAYLQDSDMFIFSNKKYIKNMIPVEIEKLTKTEKYKGVVTGTSKFGIFVEFNTILLLNLSK